MTAIVSPVVHVTLQSALGIAVGGLCDGVFSESLASPKKLDTSELLWTIAEIGGQLILNGLVVAGVAKFAKKLPESMQDNTGGLAFLFCLQGSQRHLTRKIELVGRHVAAFVSDKEDAVLQFSYDEIGNMSTPTKQKLNNSGWTGNY